MSDRAIWTQAAKIDDLTELKRIRTKEGIDLLRSLPFFCSQKSFH